MPFSALQGASIHSHAKAKLNSTAFKDAAGRAFWEASFKHKLLQTEILPKIVSLNSRTDVPAKPGVADSDLPLADYNCSYTSPRGGKLIEVLNSSGSRRTIVLSFDSRNWNNTEKFGVLVSWSDGDQAVYIDQATAVSELGMTHAEWESPGESIIGRKAPWANTFEERRR